MAHHGEGSPTENGHYVADPLGADTAEISPQFLGPTLGPNAMAWRKPV